MKTMPAPMKTMPAPMKTMPAAGSVFIGPYENDAGGNDWEYKFLDFLLCKGPNQKKKLRNLNGKCGDLKGKCGDQTRWSISPSFTSLGAGI